MEFFFFFRFDVCLLIKSFNQLNINDKQKLLKNLLLTLKTDGQVFVFESEWPKDKGLTGTDPFIFLHILFSFLLENHSSNPVDLIHHFHSATTSDKERYGFELVFARPLRSFVDVIPPLSNFF